jgi:hypothetical protein
VEIKDAHDVCRLKGEALLGKTCKHLEVYLTGTLKPCEGNSYVKVKPSWCHRPFQLKPGERLFLDTTGTFSPTFEWNSGFRWSIHSTWFL